MSWLEKLNFGFECPEPEKFVTSQVEQPSLVVETVCDRISPSIAVADRNEAIGSLSHLPRPTCDIFCVRLRAFAVHGRRLQTAELVRNLPHQLERGAQRSDGGLRCRPRRTLLQATNPLRR